MLRNSHLGRARALDKFGRHADAIVDWDRAAELSPPREQRQLRAERATSLLQAGQVERAVAEVAELTKTGGWDAEQWYDFACVYAVAGGKLKDKRDEYAGRAVELLRKAVAGGYKDHAHMAKDADLDPLRGRADFKQLAADLAKGYPTPELAPPPRPKK